MPDLVIKDVPATLRRRLLADAKRHRRSLNGEVLALLEKGLHQDAEDVAEESPARHPFLLTRRWLQEAKRQGRSIRLEDFHSGRR